HFVCANYESAGTTSIVYLDTVPGDASVSLTAPIGDCTAPLEVGGYAVDAGNKDGFYGTLGPLYWWKGTVVGAPMMATLYNSGKGMSCADAIVADPTMTRCWDLDEDPAGGAGAYKDEVTGGVSDNMTPLGTPDQATSLIIAGDGDPDLYLTAVNTPTATGGALGYAMSTVNASSQYATGGDIAALDMGSGISWGVVGWLLPTADIGAAYQVSKTLSGSFNVEGEWTCGLNGGPASGDSIRALVVDSAGQKLDASGTFGVSKLGQRIFFHCRY
ncbi:unnamed protein product, partial [marine sediment metagenome]